MLDCEASIELNTLYSALKYRKVFNTEIFLEKLFEDLPAETCGEKLLEYFTAMSSYISGQATVSDPATNNDMHCILAASMIKLCQKKGYEELLMSQAGFEWPQMRDMMHASCQKFLSEQNYVSAYPLASALDVLNTYFPEKTLPKLVFPTDIESSPTSTPKSPMAYRELSVNDRLLLYTADSVLSSSPLDIHKARITMDEFNTLSRAELAKELTSREDLNPADKLKTKINKIIAAVNDYGLNAADASSMNKIFLDPPGRSPRNPSNALSRARSSSDDFVKTSKSAIGVMRPRTSSLDRDNKFLWNPTSEKEVSDAVDSGTLSSAVTTRPFVAVDAAKAIEFDGLEIFAQRMRNLSISLEKNIALSKTSGAGRDGSSL